MVFCQFLSSLAMDEGVYRCSELVPPPLGQFYCKCRYTKLWTGHIINYTNLYINVIRDVHRSSQKVFPLDAGQKMGVSGSGIQFAGSIPSDQDIIVFLKGFMKMIIPVILPGWHYSITMMRYLRPLNLP